MAIRPPPWHERYRNEPAPVAPQELLTQFADLLPPRGLALDLACGGGRHSVFLAERGLRVVGIDRSAEALNQGRELAGLRKVKVLWAVADLGKVGFPPAIFDVIACFYYRDPGLYKLLRQWIRPGGVLLYETYTRAQLHLGVGPRNPAHLLEPGELLEAFNDWDVIFYRETTGERCVARLVVRQPNF